MNDLLILLVLLLFLTISIVSRNKVKALSAECAKLKREKKDLEISYEKLNENFQELKAIALSLKKYRPIKNVEEHIKGLKIKASKDLKQSSILANKTIKEAEAKASEIVSKATSAAAIASQEAETKISEAEAKASEIASKATSEADELLANAKSEADNIQLKAQLSAENSEQKAFIFESAAKAAKNIIDGYGDEYIIPTHSVLDEVIEEFSHKDAAKELKRVRSYILDLIKRDAAADCDYVESYRRKTAIRFILDAYNGKIDAIISGVKHSNYGILQQEIIDAKAIVESHGIAFRNARIQDKYHEARLEELLWAVRVMELKRIDREEQKAIRNQIREEEKAKREYEKAIREAEKEEKILQKAMKKARAELQSASDEQKQEFEQQLAELEHRLHEAEAKNERAISMAQQTKTGHVYIISNIGSFGENVFKVGLTRRLEPLDRVKELGDASVPFSFDVHAMIHSEDAPALEKELHRRFAYAQINKVNPRKEFFDISLHEIRETIEQLGIEVHWTMRAEALEYRESLSIKKETHNPSNSADF